jgi:hypothetical protein
VVLLLLLLVLVVLLLLVLVVLLLLLLLLLLVAALFFVVLPTVVLMFLVAEPGKLVFLELIRLYGRLEAGLVADVVDHCPLSIVVLLLLGVVGGS